MKIGIEFSQTRDDKGRRHFRVAPFFAGTEKAFNTFVITCLILATVIVFSVLINATPDPIIKPHNTVVLGGGR